MYAIVEIKGKQYKVQKGKTIFVDYLGEGDVTVPEIKPMLVKKEDDSVVVGTPYVDGVTVSASVGEMKKGKKVTIYKYKRRKDYRRKQGHRQKYHALTIDEISA